jgi:2-polyprenyl-3-methyl-5-hydroxy-6-metoxy-1,4-benzoquinol methylase
MPVAHVVVSPITGHPALLREQGVPVRTIIQQYRQDQYDVSYLFKQVEELSIYECQQTGYQFYDPAVEGDSAFYEHLQKHDWYYMPWKWEHEEAIGYLAGAETLLEVGCGLGGYLEGVRTRAPGVSAVGLELNQHAAAACRAKNLNVRQETLAEHCAQQGARYDRVCLFQVIEHVADVKGFLRDAVACLKPSGKLLVSVPNNDAFAGVQRHGLLNMPPHHVGLWNERALERLAEHIGLQFVRCTCECLQPYHVKQAQALAEQVVVGRSRILRALARLTGSRYYIDRTVRFMANWTKGHTVLAVYQKPAIGKT